MSAIEVNNKLKLNAKLSLGYTYIYKTCLMYEEIEKRVKKQRERE